MLRDFEVLEKFADKKEINRCNFYYVDICYKDTLCKATRYQFQYLSSHGHVNLFGTFNTKTIPSIITI